jgi:hypothetical protein
VTEWSGEFVKRCVAVLLGKSCIQVICEAPHSGDFGKSSNQRRVVAN